MQTLMYKTLGGIQSSSTYAWWSGEVCCESSRMLMDPIDSNVVVVDERSANNKNIYQTLEINLSIKTLERI